MPQRESSSVMAGPGIMLLSAAIFGYFGWVIGKNGYAPDQNGQIVPSWVLLAATIHASAVVFALSALLTFFHPAAGNLLYGISGVLSALLFVVVVILDHLDKTHVLAVSPILLILFAAWNGYGSWTGLRALLALRGPGSTFEAPDRRS